MRRKGQQIYESSSFKFILNSPVQLGWGGKRKMRFNTDIVIKLWFLNSVVDPNIKFNGSQPALKHEIENLNVHKKYFYVLKKIQCMYAWATCAWVHS